MAVVVETVQGGLEVEIQCHGGPAAVALVVEAIEAAGASRRPADDWIARHARSVLAAQAEIDLPRAETLRAARIVLDQAQGALDAELSRIAEDLGRDPVGAMRSIGRLIQRSQVGVRLLTGWRVALAGRPNVGKSRLLNALTGFERAIVSPTPGTTRDVVTARTAMDGWPVELADTAGLRDSTDPIESGGVTFARARHGRADLVLLVLDRSEPLTDSDRDLLADRPGALIVCNKADLPAAWEPVLAVPGDRLGRARRRHRIARLDDRPPTRSRTTCSRCPGSVPRRPGAVACPSPSPLARWSDRPGPSGDRPTARPGRLSRDRPAILGPDRGRWHCVLRDCLDRRSVAGSRNLWCHHRQGGWGLVFETPNVMRRGLGDLTPAILEET